MMLTGIMELVNKIHLWLQGEKQQKARHVLHMNGLCQQATVWGDSVTSTLNS